MVAEHEGAIPEGVAGGACPGQQPGVAGTWQRAGTVHAPLAERVGVLAQQQQG